MSRMDEIIAQAVPPEDRAAVTLEVLRFWHSCPDAGRPSDAAHAIVRLYLQRREGDLGRELHSGKRASEVAGHQDPPAALPACPVCRDLRAAHA